MIFGGQNGVSEERSILIHKLLDPGYRQVAEQQADYKAYRSAEEVVNPPHPDLFQQVCKEMGKIMYEHVCKAGYDHESQNIGDSRFGDNVFFEQDGPQRLIEEKAQRYSPYYGGQGENLLYKA